MPSMVKKLFKNAASRIRTPEYHSSRPASPSPSIRSLKTVDTSPSDRDFFDGKSHAVIFVCLNQGHRVLEDLLNYMKDFRDLSVKCAEAYQSWSNKWISRLNDQSATSSYNTTKKAQRTVIKSAVTLAALDKEKTDAINSVITELQGEIDRLYLHASSRIREPQHYQSEQLKDDFTKAFEPVRLTKNNIKEVQKKQSDMKREIHQMKVQVEDVTVFEPENEEKLRRAQEKQKTLEEKLANLDESLSQLVETLAEQQETYRVAARSLFEKFQEYEKERLDLIQSTLLKFIDAAHPIDMSRKLDEFYEKLRTQIEEEQNTSKDLEFWANTNAINLELRPTAECDSDEVTENSP